MQFDERLPLYQRLRDDLAAKIAQRVWQPDEALPSELNLAAQYSVAPGTMRKAIETLVAEGMLERRQGRGTYVRRADFTSSLFRFFRYVEAGGERVIPKSEILQRKEQAASKKVAAKLGIPAGSQVICLKRRRLTDGKPLLFEEIWLPKRLFGRLLQIPTKDYGDLLYPLYEQQCHCSIARAEELLGVELADNTLARQLGIKSGAPVVSVERLAFGFDGKPLEWRRSRGPADQFHYKVDIR